MQTARPQSFLLPSRVRDVVGKMKVSMSENIYEADFEYGTQPMRWENLIINTASSGSLANIAHMPGLGGVRMLIGNNAGDVAIRQSRPYHRYQPGKTMYMATAANFGAPVAGSVQRVGFFDDGNGVFFEQGTATAANPAGMYCVIRSDSGNVNFNTGVSTAAGPSDTKFSYENWVGDSVASLIDWTKLQMIWIEYAWYGAGCIRWGTILNGEPYVLHEVGAGNASWTGQPHQFPWARTGNLPVRYEQRNISATTSNSVFAHFGVSVMVEGRIDDQRGFTYSYGLPSSSIRRNVPQNTTRFPVISVRTNTMGVIDFSGNSTSNPIDTATANTTFMRVSGTPWVANAYVGRAIAFVGANSTGNTANTFVGRIANNTTNTVYFTDIVSTTPVLATSNSSYTYSIGLINRGQILPKTLIVSSDALCLVELVVSTAANPTLLTNATFTPMNTLGSLNSLSSRDVTANAISSGTGEVIYAFTSPAGGSGIQTFELSDLFALYNNIRGNSTDILTVAISTPSGSSANVGAHLIAQEAMS